MDCKLSVIVPTYNRAYCIKNCLEAILRCTERQMEVIVVDDGSTDNTEAVVQEVMRADNRVSLISQENNGVSKARNTGLSEARGEYLLFSDSDDWIEGENIAKLISYADMHKADIAVFGRINHYPDGRIRELLQPRKTISVGEDISAAAGMTILKNTEYGWSCCNKLYRREIAIAYDLRFIDYDSVSSEDRLFNLGYFANSSKIAFFNECAFHNIIHDGSLSKGCYFKRLVERNVQNFPTEERTQLLRFYYLSFLNNVAVIASGRNGESIGNAVKQMRETISGMDHLLKKKGLSLGKRNARLLPELSKKIRLLDWMIIERKWHSMTAAMLICLLRLLKVFESVLTNVWKI